MKYLLFLLFPFFSFGQNVISLDTIISTGRFGAADTSYKLTIIKLDRNFNFDSSATTLDTVIVYQDSTTNQREYVWEGLISQAGTDPPLVYLIRNTYPEEITFEYGGTGNVRAYNTTSLFFENKTYLTYSLQYNRTDINDRILWELASADQLRLYTYRENTETDDVMVRTYVKIVTIK
ncbi:MAG: hypothetical protein WAT92_00270 [Saprospiraceae bacterium]